MEKNLNNLRIDNPCTVSLNRMSKEGDNYYCKSCSHSVIDFTEMSLDEIKSNITANTCGIFRPEQLPGQHKIKLSRQLLYYCLTLLSFLGFSVKPLSAQNNQFNQDTSSISTISPTIKNGYKDENNIVVGENYTEESPIVKKPVKNKKRRRYQRRLRGRVMGCPEF